jgi:hypothetical protein
MQNINSPKNAQANGLKIQFNNVVKTTGEGKKTNDVRAQSYDTAQA